MSLMCREFGISRKTGYKIFERYKEHGLLALTDRSRRPVRYADQLPQQIESLIVRLKKEKPHCGARKIRELLIRRLAGDIRVPAKSTIHAVLDRHGLVQRMGKKRGRAQGTPLSSGTIGKGSDNPVVTLRKLGFQEIDEDLEACRTVRRFPSLVDAIACIPQPSAA